MIFQNCQYMVHNGTDSGYSPLLFPLYVDDRAGFRTIDTVNKLSHMFVQTESTKLSFCYVVIHKDNSLKNL